MPNPVILQPGSTWRMLFESKGVSRFRGFRITAPCDRDGKPDQEFFVAKILIGKEALLLGTLIFSALPMMEKQSRGVVLSYPIHFPRTQITLELRHPDSEGKPIELAVLMRIQYGEDTVNQAPL